MFHDAAGHEDLTEKIIRCGIRVHDELGPGLLESVYETCMVIALNAEGLSVEPGRRVPVKYRGQLLDDVLIPDLIVEKTVVVEIKSADRLHPVHKAQLITYLQLTECPVGLLMNFGAETLKMGLRRVVRPDLYRHRQRNRDQRGE